MDRSTDRTTIEEIPCHLYRQRKESRAQSVKRARSEQNEIWQATVPERGIIKQKKKKQTNKDSERPIASLKPNLREERKRKAEKKDDPGSRPRNNLSFVLNATLQTLWCTSAGPTISDLRFLFRQVFVWNVIVRTEINLTRKRDSCSKNNLT